MSTTKIWAESLGVATAADLPPLGDYSQPYSRTAQDIAIRAVILQGVVAVACEVEAQPIIGWFQAQSVWDAVTPRERAFLASARHTESGRI